jgi:hypothetical protein
MPLRWRENEANRNQRVLSGRFSAKGATSFQAWGDAPGKSFTKDTSAESANQDVDPFGNSKLPAYTFFFTHPATRSRAFSMFSIELATLKRK